LRKWRKNNGLTQREAAGKIGCSLSTYLNWEYFDRNPSLNNALRIFNASSHEVTVNDLQEAWIAHHHPELSEVVK